MDSTSQQMNRRSFVQASLAAIAATAVGCRSFDSGTNRPHHFPRPSSPANWQKHGVVLEATEPWEGVSVQHFTTCAEPLDRGAWRLWYSVNNERSFQAAYAEGIPGEPMKQTAAVLTTGEPADAPMSIGHRPAGWEPVQPVHLRLKNGRHRLYFWAHAASQKIIRYLAADSDDGRRYRVIDPLRPVLYQPSDRATYGVPSPDGVMYHAKKIARPADEPEAVSRLISNDATNVYQLPDGSFEMYSAALLRVGKEDPAYIREDNAPGLLRVIDRYTSDDGLHFENRRRVIQRDAKDPVDQQFYYLSVTHTPKGRVGLLGHYRCAAQTMDLEWCFSHDGLNWERPLRSGWLPRGEGMADSYGIYAGHDIVHHDGKWHLFYTGANETHNHKRFSGKPRQVIMYATTDSIWA